LVIRVLPAEEYGTLVLIQTIFNFVSALAYSLIFQPLTKYAAEMEENGSYIAASLIMSSLFFSLISVPILFLKVPLIHMLDPTNQTDLVVLFNYLPLLFFVSLYRVFAVSLLQSRFLVQRIFWIDTVNFIGTLILIVISQNMNLFHNAQDLIILTIIAQSASTLLSIVLTVKLMSVKIIIRREAFSKIWNLGKYTFLGNSLYMVFSQIDVFFVSSFAGVAAVATYNAAKILTRIFDIFSQILQMFLVPFSSRLNAQQDELTLKIILEKSICFSGILLLPVVIVMALFPEQLMSILYSGKYFDAAPIVRIFSLLGILIAWNAVATSYFIGTANLKRPLLYGIVGVIVAACGFSILVPFYGAKGASIAYVLSFFISTILLVKYLKKYFPLSIHSTMKRIIDIGGFFKKKLE
jgi:O-antigen/teichoic acid export membrane protein